MLCARAFSRSGEQGLLSGCSHGHFIVVTSMIVKHGILGSVAVVLGLSCSAACGLSWTRNLIYVLCIGRRILNHWTTREALL